MSDRKKNVPSLKVFIGEKTSMTPLPPTVARPDSDLPSRGMTFEAGGCRDVMLKVIGHDDACRARARQGILTRCNCQTRRPADDPAAIIELTMHYARIRIERGLPMPLSIIKHLNRYVEAGDLASMTVWDWLARRSIVSTRPPNAKRQGFALRLISRKEKQP
ncbi:hypothetical protein [Aquamicrobium zhengzhouense]|uniref:Uncharacterized protein n=1 Tax=Aquamicrobium zhengzhouense TaxID=2781738 RepID=A0ABS0SC18_9HYPH|nr:hypothetical protein [Aquamicrobium zhengzhouense]MBI1620811.1 hypothetical protein [Aquamicrobium zhengzhouense]